MYNAFGSNSNPSLPVTNSSNDRVAFDNLLRRELKVADPSDAGQVAEALLKRYKDDRRAQAIDLEAQGMPFLGAAPVATAVQIMPTASSGEWAQAVNDVERDLRELTGSSQLKDFSPELNGWTQSIRALVAELEGASRIALDPRQRDKTLSLRRQLSDYARLARLVGALSPNAQDDFRQLACSLDEAAAVSLVRIGEALADVGFSGNYLLQTPYSELQTRRDAAIYALRVLVGATQQAYGPNDWPRGLNAYRKLYEALEQQGQGDLRSLLVETELSRVMDEVIQRAGDGTADGLRAAGATAEVDLMRFRRLYLLGRNLVQPESPPLTAFLEALQLFADAFRPSGGSRLLRIARPPILFYGIYATQSVLRADRRLLGLVTVRTRLAEELDAFAECGCDAALVQGSLDLCLHSLDRAIDLYAAGRDEFGVAECRASAFAYLILAVEELLSDDTREAAEKFLEANVNVDPVTKVDRRAEIEKLIAAQFPNESERQVALAEWRGVVHRVTVLDANMEVIQPTLNERARTLTEIQSSLDDAIRLLAPFATPSGDWDNEARTAFFEESRIRIRTEELCAQLRQEQGWGTLVPGLVQRASNEGRLVGADGALEWLVRRAVVLNEHLIGQAAVAALPPLFLSHDCPTGIDIPPHYETLLDGIAFDVGRGGSNRFPT
jgi:hypothetical protein